MGYFPFFVELSEKRGLIVGGGKVALRKVQKLLPYGPKLTVVAPEIGRQLRDIGGLILRQRAFALEDMAACDFVIAATDDHELNHRIAEACQAQRLPVNVADSKEMSSFLFPALVKRGDLSVGISTSGAGPSAAVYFKEQFEALLPENLEEILTCLRTARKMVQENVPEGGRRKELLTGLFAECVRTGQPLTEGELKEKLREVQEENR